MNPILVAAVVAVAAVAGCGGASPVRAHQHDAVPAQAKLTEFQACRILLADVRHTRGVPDVPTLRRIADQATTPRLAADARTAVRDIAHTGIAPLAFALLRSECAQAGVQIPPP